MILLVLHALEATFAARLARVDFLTEVSLFYATNM
jgi:hypothetical protein